MAHVQDRFYAPPQKAVEKTSLFSTCARPKHPWSYDRGTCSYKSATNGRRLSKVRITCIYFHRGTTSAHTSHVLRRPSESHASDTPAEAARRLKELKRGLILHLQTLLCEVVTACLQRLTTEKARGTDGRFSGSADTVYMPWGTSGTFKRKHKESSFHVQ